jgi:hypothetical protein
VRQTRRDPQCAPQERQLKINIQHKPSHVMRIRVDAESGRRKNQQSLES